MSFCAELEGNGKLPKGHSGHMSQAISGLKAFSGIDGPKSPRLLLGPRPALLMVLSP